MTHARIEAILLTEAGPGILFVTHSAPMAAEFAPQTGRLPVPD